MNRSTGPSGPKLPGAVALALGLIPAPVNSFGLCLVLNRLFAPALAEGELEFLRDRHLLIRVCDARLDYHLALSGTRFRPATDRDEDLVISGDLYDFLLLAARREDPDTLFFQRRLKLQGSTALGLRLKNFLDALDDPPLPAAARSLLDRALDVYGRMF